MFTVKQRIEAALFAIAVGDPISPIYMAFEPKIEKAIANAIFKGISRDTKDTIEVHEFKVLD